MGDYKLFNYYPSMGAAVLFTILFALTTAAHLYRCVSTRTRFVIPIIIGGLCECSCCPSVVDLEHFCKTDMFFPFLSSVVLTSALC